MGNPVFMKLMSTRALTRLPDFAYAPSHKIGASDYCRFSAPYQAEVLRIENRYPCCPLSGRVTSIRRDNKYHEFTSRLSSTPPGGPRRPGSSACGAERSGSHLSDSGDGGGPSPPLNDAGLQRLVWGGFGVYVLWLLFLPFAPGDPVWALKGETLSDLLDLSLNFFFLLPAANAVGYHLMEAPILHPSAEALFNIVNAWSLMFGPLLVTDRRRAAWGGSVEALWTAQMFLTNVFLFPYMALRLNVAPPPEPPAPSPASGQSVLHKGLAENANSIGWIGGVVGLVSIAWFAIGRYDNGFGSVVERWQYFIHYISSDRPAYAFVWDMGLYTAFQAWLIKDNMGGQDGRPDIMEKLRFLPFFGLAVFLITRPTSPKQ